MLSRRAVVCCLFLFALLAGACARGARPVATEDTRRLASQQGVVVLGQTITREDPAAVPADPETLPVLEAAPQPGRLVALSPLPYAASSKFPTINAVHLVCVVDGVEAWVRVAPGAGEVLDPEEDRKLSVKVSMQLPDGDVPVLFVARVMSQGQFPTQLMEWQSFPGDPAQRPDLVGQLCLEPAWDVTVEVEDDGRNLLRADLTVAVRDEGWLDANFDTFEVTAPQGEVANITVPWLDPLSGFIVRAVEIHCELGVPGPQLDVVATGSPVLPPHQWFAVAENADALEGNPGAARWVGARGSVQTGQLSTIDGWAVDVDLPAELCGQATWPVWVRLSNGGASVFEGVVDATVVNQV